jgi:hypothetical protein
LIDENPFAALVFFIAPTDPRFLSTMQQILKPPKRGGLTANNLVYRYDVSKSQDGVGGEEGAFGPYRRAWIPGEADHAVSQSCVRLGLSKLSLVLASTTRSF